MFSSYEINIKYYYYNYLYEYIIRLMLCSHIIYLHIFMFNKVTGQVSWEKLFVFFRRKQFSSLTVEMSINFFFILSFLFLFFLLFLFFSLLDLFFWITFRVHSIWVTRFSNSSTHKMKCFFFMNKEVYFKVVYPTITRTSFIFVRHSGRLYPFIVSSGFIFFQRISCDFSFFFES